MARSGLLALFLIVTMGMGEASADYYVQRQRGSREIRCYNKVYVEATIAVNTRGRLVSPERHAWEETADKMRRVREPAVYLERRRVIEPDHYTLAEIPCPPDAQ
jgi:hypothetical protein